MSSTAQDDVIDLLVAQHEAIRSMLRQLQEEAVDAGAMVALRRLLSAHETVEEEVVHPRFRRIAEGGPDAAEWRMQEETILKQLQSELEAGGRESPDFGARLVELADGLARHFAAEETEEFSALRRHLAPEQLARMATEARIAMSVAPTRPHPGLDTALANIVATPVIATLDRVQDVVDGALGHRDSA